MSLGLAFWVVLLVAVVFGGFGFWRPDPPRWWAPGFSLVLLVLLVLLGWRVFGPALHG